MLCQMPHFPGHIPHLLHGIGGDASFTVPNSKAIAPNGILLTGNHKCMTSAGLRHPEGACGRRPTASETFAYPTHHHPSFNARSGRYGPSVGRDEAYRDGINVSKAVGSFHTVYRKVVPEHLSIFHFICRPAATPPPAWGWIPSPYCRTIPVPGSSPMTFLGRCDGRHHAQEAPFRIPILFNRTLIPL